MPSLRPPRLSQGTRSAGGLRLQGATMHDLHAPQRDTTQLSPRKGWHWGAARFPGVHWQSGQTPPLCTAELQCVSLTGRTRSMAGMWIRRFPDTVSLERQVNLTGCDRAPLLRVLSNMGTKVLTPPTSDQGTPTARREVKVLTLSLQPWHRAESPLQRPSKIPTLTAIHLPLCGEITTYVLIIPSLWLIFLLKIFKIPPNLSLWFILMKVRS